jgi:hypothetical protein
VTLAVRAEVGDERAVAGRLVARLDELLPELGATYRREIGGYARPGEEAALVSLASGWIDRLDQASSRVAAGYLEASHERLRRLDARRAELADALLDATDHGEVAAVGERFAVAVAPVYRPVVLTGPDVVVRADAVLSSVPDAFVDRRGEGLLVLLPGAGDEGCLAVVVGADLVVTGRPTPPGRSLAEEVRRTLDLLDVAVRDGRTRGTVTVDDLPLHRLAVAAGPVADDLADRLLAPLEDRPELRITLDAYLATGAIPEVAARLEVHPNTVAHRLRRVRDLTGADPRVPRDAALLVVALIARGSRA